MLRRRPAFLSIRHQNGENPVNFQWSVETTGRRFSFILPRTRRFLQQDSENTNAQRMRGSGRDLDNRKAGRASHDPPLGGIWKKRRT